MTYIPEKENTCQIIEESADEIHRNNNNLLKYN